MISNNEITLSGKCIQDMEYSHSVKTEDFFKSSMEIKRLSDKVDVLNLTVPENLCGQMTPGGYYTVKGQLRTYNRFFENKTCLVLTVFVKEVEPCHVTVCQNDIMLNGFICKPPVYRTTPFNRQICDILLAVNRGFNKSDYIPCISWGSNAFFTSGLAVGTNVVIKGRLQSREYDKVGEDGQVQRKTAYEVSVASIEVKNKK